VSLPDQRSHWDALRQRNPPPTTQRGPSSFAQHCATRVSPRSTVLELGCGPARDGAYFATLGHTVVATDFSIAALDPAKSIFADQSGIHFCLLDTAAPLPFPDQSFEAVYARLSLHYFPDQMTRRVFRELHRVLRPEGALCFMCKSTGDPLYGRGRQIEPNMFELEGHIRHFFASDYARSCLDPDFDVIELAERRRDLPGQTPAVIEVIARTQ
jgi:SAM-dependent methyltransferase